MTGIRQPLLLATRNPGKLRELSEILAARGLRAETLDQAGVAESAQEDELEAFGTFEENAAAKARWFAMRTGRMVLADDSGLCVDALGGKPGVESKRWSGRSDLSGTALDHENNRLLLAALEAAALKGNDDRAARYVCAAVCAWPEGLVSEHAKASEGWARGEVFFAGEKRGDGRQLFRGDGVCWVVAVGECPGTITAQEAGGEGFGYDPLFAPSELGGLTFGELTGGEKETVSHRGKAFRKLLNSLTEVGVL